MVALHISSYLSLPGNAWVYEVNVQCTASKVLTYHLNHHVSLCFFMFLDVCPLPLFSFLLRRRLGTSGTWLLELLTSLDGRQIAANINIRRIRRSD